MKHMLLVALALTLVACDGDKTVVINNNDRVAELERRANLNDELDNARDVLIAGQAEALALETEARIAGDETLAELIVQEAEARENGDEALANSLAISVVAQTLVNLGVQFQISQINNKITIINSKILTLKNRVDDLEENLDDLEGDVSNLAGDLADLQLTTQSQIDELAINQAATQSQLDQQGVQLFKCNSANSSERILKINGRFYAAMNRVTTQNINVVTGSTSQSYTTPDMCQTWDGQLELPNSGGQCTPNAGPFKSTKIPGTTVVVPSYSTSSVTVVTSVKIAIDILNDGNYVTTDGGPACSFSISNSGTSSTNLISVQ